MDALLWQDKALSLLDQTKYPQEEIWHDCVDFRSVIQVLKSGIVRGDSLPGIAGAYGYCLAALEYQGSADFHKQMAEARRMIGNSLPMTHSLALALEKMDKAYEEYRNSPDLVTALLATAVTVHRTDVVACRAMNREGAGILPEEANIILSTRSSVFHSGGYGGTLGVLRSGFNKKKVARVFVCENRPGLEGAKQIAGELAKNKIPTTLIPDQMAATLMAQHSADMVLTDGIRMAANGDLLANAGTYELAIAAYFHSIPFYATVFTNDIDRKLTDGTAFPLEDGDSSLLDCPENVNAWTPRLDVLPNYLLTGVITNKGLAFPPYNETLEELLLKTQEKSFLVL